MAPQDRRRLADLVRELMEGHYSDAAWVQVHQALTSLGEVTAGRAGDWRPAAATLFDLAAIRSPRRGLEDSLDDAKRKPAPPPTRELATRLIRRLGVPPAEERRADDPD
jgi:hypothetical protein